MKKGVAAVILAIVLLPVLLIAALLEMLLGGLFVPSAGSPEEAFQQSAEMQALMAQRNPPARGAGMVEIAQAEWQEGGGLPRGQRYWDYWGVPAEDWCCDFVYYCADQLGLVGEDKPFGTYTAWVPGAYAQLRAGGAYLFTLYNDTPQAGDIVFYYDTEGKAARTLNGTESPCHIGIVVNYDDEILRTIEGNVGGNDMYDSIVRKCGYAHPYGQAWAGTAILGFARPAYAASAPGQGLTDFIASFEGFSQYPVWDYGQYSVGYGTRCPDGKFTDYKLHGITEEEARELLAQYTEAATAQVTAWAAKEALELSQEQLDALASLTYNIGPGWLTSDGYASFRSLLISGGSEAEIASAFAQICHAGGEVLPGLVERRICEAYLYCHGS